MQHRYVPDLGDFSKFAVIDALSGRGEQKTALIWYLVDPHEVGDSHKNDGKHTAYLHRDRGRLSDCHPELYRRFKEIYRSGEKHVGVYERHGVLPNLTYFAEPLSYSDLSLVERQAWRRAWLGRAVRAAGDASMVVLDPDNGLMADRVSIRSKSAVKYATLDECVAFYGNGQRTLVLYQHAHRQGTVEEQAERALSRLTDQLGVERDQAFAMRFHRGTTRCYLVIPAKGQGEQIRERADTMVCGPWGHCGHFSLIR